MYNITNNKYHVLHTDNEVTVHDTLDEAKKEILENYIDSTDGIHPEVESIFIFKVTDVISVNVEEEETKDGTLYHKVMFK